MPGDPWMIGDIAMSAVKNSQDLQAHVEKARQEYKAKHGHKVDGDTEVARRGHVEGKLLEEMVLAAIDNQFQASNSPSESRTGTYLRTCQGFRSQKPATVQGRWLHNHRGSAACMHQGHRHQSQIQ